MGGASGEHSISLRSAAAVTEALEQAGHAVMPLGITRGGSWRTGDFGDLLAAARGELVEVGEDLGRPVTLVRDGDQVRTMPLQGPLRASEGRPIDVVFPILHGPGGEDGTLQGQLEMLGVPFVGAGCRASALAMDKIASKVLCAGAGLAQVDFLVAGERDADGLAAAIDAAFGFPCFVKPAALGSSVGISRVETSAELGAALDEARRWDARVIIERAVDVREIELALLGNETPEFSPAGEIIIRSGFYDFESKYVNDSAELVAGAEVASEQRDAMQAIAREFWQLIGCRGMARADFFVERSSGRVLFNEFNTIPGFTAISMYPRLWNEAGVDLPQLVARLIDLALRSAPGR
jgi:D-alanine-D-alanine ligase